MALTRRDADGTVEHAFPLRPNLVIYMRLPVDLTMADAERLANIIRALAMPEQEADTKQKATEE